MMDQPTREITAEGGIRSNIILDGTKTKLIYATHNSLHVFDLLQKDEKKRHSPNYDFKIRFKSDQEDFLNLEDKFSRIWMNPSPQKTRVFL